MNKAESELNQSLKVFCKTMRVSKYFVEQWLTLYQRHQFITDDQEDTQNNTNDPQTKDYVTKNDDGDSLKLTQKNDNNIITILVEPKKNPVRKSSSVNINNKDKEKIYLTENNEYRYKRNVTYTMKLEIAAKQDFQCKDCQEKLDETMQIDHRLALCFGGNNERPNLAAVCAKCHIRKTNREREEARLKRQLAQGKFKSKYKLKRNITILSDNTPRNSVDLPDPGVIKVKKQTLNVSPYFCP